MYKCTANIDLEICHLLCSYAHLQSIPVILVVTGVSLMVLDPKNLSLKYRIELQHVKQLSMSTYSDHIIVVHIDPVSQSLSLFLCLSLSDVCYLQYKATDRSYTKGDFIFRNANIVEMVTKTHAVIQEGFSKKLKVVFSNE